MWNERMPVMQVVVRRSPLLDERCGKRQHGRQAGRYGRLHIVDEIR